MRSRFGTAIAGAAVAVLLASTATIFGATTTVGGITVVTPDYTRTNPLNSCEPWEDATGNRITVSGIPEGSTVQLNFVFSDDTTMVSSVLQTHLEQSGSVSYAIPYPQDTTLWPIQTDTFRAIVVNVQVSVDPPTGGGVKIGTPAWKVVCTPTPPSDDFQGCTPGYWRQDHHFDSWVGYLPSDSFDHAFGVTSTIDPPGRAPVLVNPTLLDAVWIGGGGENAMARHAVAALLNASSPDVHYPMSVGEVVAAVQAAYGSGNFAAAQSMFEGFNEIGCPLN
jgi:hypothetical protein